MVVVVVESDFSVKLYAKLNNYEIMKLFTMSQKKDVYNGENMAFPAKMLTLE